MIPTMGSKCHQCGTMHPPLQPGQKCPMAIATAKTQETDTGKKIEIFDITDTIVTIMVSQIERKNIKDVKKLKGYVILQLTKLLEGYSE